MSGLKDSPYVERGRLSVPGRGDGRVFMFNPTEVDDSKATNWGSVEVPGASHPVYQYGSGGERLISFTLYIDGDRGRYGRMTIAPGPHNTASLSIMDELMWYRSLVYPSQYGGSYANVAPYVVLLTHSVLYNNLPCIVKKADFKVNYWVPDPKNGGKLLPVRATVAMAFAEIVSKSQTSQDVLNLLSTGVNL